MSSKQPEQRPVTLVPAGGAPKDAPRAQPPTAAPAHIKPRHRWLALSFPLVVLAPALVVGAYLWLRAVDQYESSVGFTVRSEEPSSAVDVLGGLTALSGASSSDTDLLYEFIQSQQLVASVDAALDLKTIYAAPYDTDPVFALMPDASIEDLVDFWRDMVLVTYEPGTGLLEVTALAFEPQEARAIAEAVYEESARTINDLSAVAREDATRYAREELSRAADRLKAAREALTAFRARTRIVDPQADLEIQMGLLNTLQQSLGQELITLDQLRSQARAGDPRLAQSESRIASIRGLIQQEREKFGGETGAISGDDYATVVAEFERLTVDREFAELTHTAALTALNVAQAEARRTSRYLAAYLEPTLAETPRHPRRWLILGLTVLFLTIGWSILTLIYYARCATGADARRMITFENLTKSFWTPDGPKVVLSDVNLTIPAGQSVALLGRNGAGKSTMLRMIAGSMNPDSGRIHIDGTVSYPVGFAGSFHGDLTGAQNARFVARIYGADTESLLEFVTEFAALGGHMHLPLRLYSSGMRSRLAFGISMALQFDIYLVDEVTSVGDAAFRRKSSAIFAARMANASAIVVSHSMGDIRRFCTAGAVLEGGEMRYFDDVEEAIALHDANMKAAR